MNIPIKQTATITGTGVAILVNLTGLNQAVSKFAVLAKGTGGVPTALTAALEASNDGTNFTSIQAITQANDGATLFVVDKLATIFRVNVSAITLAPATNVVFTLLAGN